MTLDEAAKILEEFEFGKWYNLTQEDISALKLGDEALKWLKNTRGDSPVSFIYTRLPGETEE